MRQLKKILLQLLFIGSVFSCREGAHQGELENTSLLRLADSLVKVSKSLGDRNKILARQLADSALKISIGCGDKRICARANSQIGLLLYNAGNLDSALIYHRKALELRRSISDTLEMGYSYANICAVLNSYGVYARSKIYNDSSLWAFEQVKDTFQFIRMLQPKGVITMALEGHRAALRVFQEYERMSREFGNKEVHAVACSSLGRTYYNLNNIDSAIYWIEQASGIYKELNDSLQLLKELRQLSVYYFRKSDYAAGSQKLAEVEILFKRGMGNAFDSLGYIEVKFIGLLAKAGQDSLIPYFEDCFIAEEEYYDKLHSSQLSEMEAEYQLNARIAQNKQLHLQNQQYKIRFMSVILLLFGLVIILVLIVSYYKNKRSLNMREMELKERHIRNILQEQELKTVNAALEGKDQERTRIARELHDRLGYILALAKLNFSSLQEDLSRVQNESAERLIRINEMLDEASMEVRRISHDLYGSSVFNFGITTALHQLAEAVSAANKIQVRFHSQYVPSDIRLELQVSVYRIVGELISNSLKHAKPSQIDIQLFGRAGELVLTYEDDGNGFDTEDDSWKSGMGYSNIEARLKKYKGSYIVESAPGRGMYFQAEFPSIYLDPEA
jgi:signal transduction histidine kinase